MKNRIGVYATYTDKLALLLTRFRCKLHLVTLCCSALQKVNITIIENLLKAIKTIKL